MQTRQRGIFNYWASSLNSRAHLWSSIPLICARDKLSFYTARETTSVCGTSTSNTRRLYPKPFSSPGECHDVNVRDNCGCLKGQSCWMEAFAENYVYVLAQQREFHQAHGWGGPPIPLVIDSTATRPDCICCLSSSIKSRTPSLTGISDILHLSGKDCFFVSVFYAKLTSENT